jgi:hypothetical protein
MDREEGERELRCVVRYRPTGLDLRLMKGDNFIAPSFTTMPMWRMRRPLSGRPHCWSAVRGAMTGCSIALVVSGLIAAALRILQSS